MNAKAALPKLVPPLAVAVSFVGAYLLYGGSTSAPPTTCDKATKTPAFKPRSRLIFIGTGSSTGCPRPLCPMVFRSVTEQEASPEVKQMRQELQSHCIVSSMAIDGDPKTNKNYRNNPSLLISQCNEKGECKNVIIDVGKTFREGSLRWFPERGITSLDGIVLTHEHMDAAAGLDDVRGFQKGQGLYTVKHQGLNGKRPKAVAMPVHLSQPCLDQVSQQFPWLFPNHQKHQRKKEEPSDKPIVERFVASFDVNVFAAFVPFNVQGLSIVPLPVMHGEDLVSFGYAFTVGSINVVYLSDISRMLPETLDYIQNQLGETDILVLDALHPARRSPTHFCMEEAVELAKQIQPKQTYLLGMNCDSFLPHDEMNAKLRKDYGALLSIQLAHDGLEIDAS